MSIIQARTRQWLLSYRSLLWLHAKGHGLRGLLASAHHTGLQVFGEGQALGEKSGLSKEVSREVYCSLMGGHIPPGTLLLLLLLLLRLCKHTGRQLRHVSRRLCGAHHAGGMECRGHWLPCHDSCQGSWGASLLAGLGLHTTQLRTACAAAHV